MKHVAAYLLLVLGGNANPDAAAIGKLLSSVGIEPDKEKCAKLVAELHGKDIHTVIAEGSKKLASLPSAGAAAPAITTAPKEDKKEDKKEEKKKKDEPKEEEDEDMGFGLFD